MLNRPGAAGFGGQGARARHRGGPSSWRAGGGGAPGWGRAGESEESVRREAFSRPKGVTFGRRGDG